MSTTPPSPTSVPAEAPRRAALRSLDEALAALLADLAPVCAAAPEVLPTSEALGRVLAADVVSLLDVPPADNTSMDGYAMRAADVPREGAVLPVSQRIPAGVVGEPLQPGTAARFLLTVFPLVMMILSLGFSFLSDFKRIPLDAREEEE